MKYPALSPIRLVAPSTAPVTVAEAKAHLRIDSDDENAVLTALIDAATAHLDGWAGVLGRCLITQRWRQDFHRWDCHFTLPFPDVSSIVSITYRDETHQEQTLASSGYSVPRQTAAGSIVSLWDETVRPALSSRPAPVSVTFEAGYGSAATDVPQALRTAILLMVADLFETRQTAIIGAAASEVPLSLSVKALLAPYRMTRLN